MASLGHNELRLPYGKPQQIKANCDTSNMKLSWHGSAFCITSPLWGESTHWTLVDSHHKGLVMQNYDATLVVNAKQGVKPTVKQLMSWDVMMLIWRHCYVFLWVYFNFKIGFTMMHELFPSFSRNKQSDQMCILPIIVILLSGLFFT